MSVKVTVHGADKDSDEYHAALKLKKIIQDALPGSAEGEIVLYASATLLGQAVKDVDIIMLGNLKGYSVTAEFNDKSAGRIREQVEIQSFSTVIEVKRHDISGIRMEGTDIYVKYGDRVHSVTAQSNGQKYSAIAFFESVLRSSPFITNLIWFTQVSPADMKGLLSTEDGSIPSNVLGAEFPFGDLVRLLISQKEPYKAGKKWIFDSQYGECSLNDFQKALTMFSRSKAQMGELTRKKIEMISRRTLQASTLVDTEGKVSVYRGRAGTGKTIGLIQAAIQLVDKERARVLILTYNRALVLDIRRMFALAELPDMFDEKCVFVNTLDSYFMRLANEVLYENRLEWEEYTKRKDEILRELNDLMPDEDGIALVRDAASQNGNLDWDYLLIDEAQDWIDAERDIVMKLFDKGHIIIADGGNQYVRRRSVCDWNIIRERKEITLKVCRRQKENLISFLNAYAAKSGVSTNKIVGNGEMLGGRVIITTDDRIIGIHKQEMESLRKSGNIAYDMLYLVPHALVQKDGSGKDPGFIWREKFESEGIRIWDGTLWSNRSTSAVNGDEIRVLQYDSSRGLEGWTVVCLDFDVFLEEKAGEYAEDDTESLALKSPEEKLKEFLYNWSMIPLTRAIDTLIITVKDPEAEVGEIIRAIANECEDYLSILIRQ